MADVMYTAPPCTQDNRLIFQTPIIQNTPIPSSTPPPLHPSIHHAPCSHLPSPLPCLNSSFSPSSSPSSLPLPPCLPPTGANQIMLSSAGTAMSRRSYFVLGRKHKHVLICVAVLTDLPARGELVWITSPRRAGGEWGSAEDVSMWAAM